MTSKVLVKLPVVPFSQRKKPPVDIMAPMPVRNEETYDGRFQEHTPDKITQLEQNMKFLQDQHQITLHALHQEVETLRQKNRDLQFQLVFSDGANLSLGSPSSPEYITNGFSKAKGSPPNVNVTPLQIEILEKEMQDLKISLNEAKRRNIYLSETLEKQKILLESTEKQKTLDVGVQVDAIMECQQVEMQARLVDAEALIKRLRQENEEQRKEIANLKITTFYTNGNRNGGSGNRSRGTAQNSYHGGQEAQGQDENYHKFPPLLTQSYWHRGSRGSLSYNHIPQCDYHRNPRHHQDLESPIDGSTVLPQLQNVSVRVENSASYPPFYRSSRGQSNTYYKDNGEQRGGNRKYNQKPQRRDQSEYHSKENQRLQQHHQQQPPRNVSRQ